VRVTNEMRKIIDNRSTITRPSFRGHRRHRYRENLSPKGIIWLLLLIIIIRNLISKFYIVMQTINLISKYHIGSRWLTVQYFILQLCHALSAFKVDRAGVGQRGAAIVSRNRTAWQMNFDNRPLSIACM